MVTAQSKARDTSSTLRQTPKRRESSRGQAVERGASQSHVSDFSCRKCLVTGEIRPKDELIRFVVDPTQRVVPDLVGRLPGRGLWVLASRATLETATKKKLFSRAAKKAVAADADLPEGVEKLLARRCLDLLGMARGAGLVVTGQPQVEEELKAGNLAYVLMAFDAGSNILKKLQKTPLINSGFDRTQLGEALGREQAVVLGLKPHSLTEKLKQELMRWQGVKAAQKNNFTAGGSKR